MSYFEFWTGLVIGNVLCETYRAFRSKKFDWSRLFDVTFYEGVALGGYWLFHH